MKQILFILLLSPLFSKDQVTYPDTIKGNIYLCAEIAPIPLLFFTQNVYVTRVSIDNFNYKVGGILIATMHLEYLLNDGYHSVLDQTIQVQLNESIGLNSQKSALFLYIKSYLYLNDTYTLNITYQ